MRVLSLIGFTLLASSYGENILSSSLFDLKVVSSDDCSPYKRPPRPSCNPDVRPSLQTPVILVDWKLDGHLTTVEGICARAVNMTYTCDYRYAIYSLIYVKEAKSIVWPWVKYPSKTDLLKALPSGFSEGAPKPPCYLFYTYDSAFSLQSIRSCSVQVGSDGKVIGGEFSGCDLSNQENCTETKFGATFTPIQKTYSFKSCPVTLVNIDIGIMEKVETKKGGNHIVVSGVHTKRLYHWSINGSHVKLACQNVEAGLSVYQDDGGYLISLTNLKGSPISPLSLMSSEYVRFNNISSLSPDSPELKKDLITFRDGLTKKIGGRNRRGVTPAIFEIIMLAAAGGKGQKNPRGKRDISSLDIFDGGVSSLQRDFGRAEYQHDFIELTKLLRHEILSIHAIICASQTAKWIELSLTQSTEQSYIRFLTPEPLALFVPSQDLKNSGLVCIPKFPQDTFALNLTASIIGDDGWVQVLDDFGESWWLMRDTGFVFQKKPNLRLPGSSFLIPLLSGCSHDLRTSNPICPQAKYESDTSYADFLHSSAPMYTLGELKAMMTDPLDHTTYSRPDVVPEEGYTTLGNGILGDFMNMLLSPITAIWKRFSPNFWTLIYTVLGGFVLLKLLIIWSHKKIITRLPKQIIEERLVQSNDPEEIGLGYYPMH